MYCPAGSRSILHGAFGVIRTWTMTYVSNRILEILRKIFNSVARALNFLVTGDIVLVHPAAKALISDCKENYDPIFKKKTLYNYSRTGQK